MRGWPVCCSVCVCVRGCVRGCVCTNPHTCSFSRGPEGKASGSKVWPSGLGSALAMGSGEGALAFPREPDPAKFYLNHLI